MSKLTSILAVCRLEEEEGSETAWGCFRRCQRRIRENEYLTIKGPALEDTPEQGRGARGGAWAALHPGGSRTCSWSSGVLRTDWPPFILASSLKRSFFVGPQGMEAPQSTSMLSSHCPPPLCVVFKKEFCIFTWLGKK